MKPRLPSTGGGSATRGHLRLLSGAVITPNSRDDADAESEATGLEGRLSDADLAERADQSHRSQRDSSQRDSSQRDSAPESSAQPAHTPEPEWAEGKAAAAPVSQNVEHVPVSVRMAALNVLADAQLVALALTGEARAFEILYRRHVAFAIHLATRIEGSARDVEDIVHDAFIKAFSRLRDLSDPAAFRSWLGSIVVFAVRSRLRRTRLMNLLGLGRGSDPVDLDSIASSDASPHTRAQLAQIYALLRMRPADDRIAWTLRCVEGHELEVVARLTNCSLATVKRRVSRIQGFLDEHFVTDAVESGRKSADPLSTPLSVKSGSKGQSSSTASTNSPSLDTSNQSAVSQGREAVSHRDSLPNRKSRP